MNDDVVLGKHNTDLPDKHDTFNSKMSKKFKALQKEYSELKLKYQQLEQESNMLRDKVQYFECTQLTITQPDTICENPFSDILREQDVPLQDD